MTRIITLTSSSDGVGKTGIAINLSARLAVAGKRVCLLELVADGSAASTRLDVPVISTLSDRLSGAADGEPLAVALPAGFDLVSGGTEEDWLWGLSTDQLAAMTADLQSLEDYDFVLIDAGTGSTQNQLAFSLASPQLWLVVTPEPASLSDAYARLKLLYAEGYAGRISVLVNKADNHKVGQYTYDKFKEIASFYLDMQLPLAGILSEVDEAALTGIIPRDAVTHVDIVTDLSNLVDRLLAQCDEIPQLDMATFGQHYLQAAGNVNDDEGDTAMTPAFSDQQPRDDLQQQLDLLSGQVDELIAEIERLRNEDAAEAAALISMPAVFNRQQAEERCSQACIAAMANRTEQVTVHSESFAVYHMRRSNGEVQRFSFHSIDDDLEEPEPKTHLS